MKIIKVREVIEMTSLSNSTIYRMCNEDKFPKKIKLGTRSVGWRESDIIDFINKCAGNS